MMRLIFSSVLLGIEFLLIYYLIFRTIHFIKQDPRKKVLSTVFILIALLGFTSSHVYLHIAYFKRIQGWSGGILVAYIAAILIVPYIIIHLSRRRLYTESTENEARTKPKLQLSCAKKLFFTVIVIIFTLVFVELAARMHVWLFWGANPWRFGQAAAVPHPFLPYIYQPANDKSPFISDHNFKCDQNLTIEKPPNTYRIAILGGSAANALTGNYNDCWSKRLQELLRKSYPDKNIEVINAAVGGWTSAECLINLELRVLDLFPDLVIFFELQNDLATNRWPNFKSDYSHWRLSKITPGTIEYFILNYSIFAQTIRLFTHQRGLKRYSSIAEDGLKAYARNITSMIGICRVNNIKIMLATYAKNDTAVYNALQTQKCLTFEGIQEGYAKYNDKVRELAEKNGVPLLDNALLLTKPEYFNDFVHFSIEGNSVVAKNFHNKIMELGLIE
jgi:lysophospholipase L1-like esterase